MKIVKNSTWAEQVSLDPMDRLMIRNGQLTELEVNWNNITTTLNRNDCLLMISNYYFRKLKPNGTFAEGPCSNGNGFWKAYRLTRDCDGIAIPITVEPTLSAEQAAAQLSMRDVHLHACVKAGLILPANADGIRIKGFMFAPQEVARFKAFLAEV